MPTHDDATVAAVFRATLTLGLATPADLVPWADEQVTARERPAEWILDLCLSAASTPEEMDRLLRAPSEGADPSMTFRLLVGLIEDRDWSYERVRRADELMWAAALHSGVQDFLDEITAIDDGFYLMFYEGRGDWTALQADVVAFVGKHADPAARAWLPGVRVTFGDGPAPPATGMMGP